MNKTGVVLKIEKKHLLLMTNTGEFVKVKLSPNKPRIGETYTGVMVKNKRPLKHYIAVAMLLFMFLSGGGAYTYFTPVASIELSINPAIEIKINRFNKIISCSPLNSDGKTILEHLKLRNKNIDEALVLVVNQAKKDNFINDNYIEQGKTISIKIQCKDETKIINLKRFEECIVENKINMQLNNNGKESKQEFHNNEKSPINKEDNKNLDNSPSDKQIKENNNNEKINKTNDNLKDKNNFNNKVNNGESKNNDLKDNNKSVNNKETNSPEKKDEIKSNNIKAKEKP